MRLLPERRFKIFARRAALDMGSSRGFTLAAILIGGWLLSGPLFNFSPQWLSTFSAAIGAVTFLMVFLIQSSQNRDSAAINLKLNELLRAVEHARDEMVTLESSSEEELQKFQQEFAELRRGSE